MRLAATIAAAATLAISSVEALPKVTRAGRYLYTEDGNRFYIKGIAYQEQAEVIIDPATGFPEPTTFVDPLSKSDACTRDVANLQLLGVNAVRIYSVDSTLNHDSCMSTLSAAGIYTIIDLSLPQGGSISRTAPEWSLDLMNSYLRTIDAFKGYDNVLAYNVGNEVVADEITTNTAPFIKAAARDVKAYLKSIGSSALVGYASTDGSGWRDPLATYLACGSEDVSIDIYGLNNYRWCGTSTVAAAYGETNLAFANYPIPAYFSEYGCNRQLPRIWEEVAGLYSSEMSNIWSGGVAFSYFPTSDNFGITTVSGDTVTVTEEFTNLAAQLTIVQPPNTPAQAAQGPTTFPTCPAQSTSFVASSNLPPTPNAAACNCLVDTASCQFTPAISDLSVLAGQLFNYTCPELGKLGGTCDDLSTNGATGTYGKVAYCDASSKLTYVFTLFYEASNRAAASCDFAGNATINRGAPSNAASVTTAIDQCLTATPAVFTPTGPSTPHTPGSGGNGGGSNTSGGASGSNPTNTQSAPTNGNRPGSAAALFVDNKSLLATSVTVVLAVVAGSWTVLM